MGVYLDFNSTAPIDERVLEEMIKIYRIRQEMQIAEHTLLAMMQDGQLKLQELKLRLCLVSIRMRCSLLAVLLRATILRFRV